MTPKQILLVAVVTAAPNTIQPPDIQQQAVNACVMPAVPGVELASCNLEFNALGEVVLAVKNRGSASTNAAAASTSTAARRTTSGPPIGIDLYMQDKLVVSLSQTALAAGQSRTIVTAIPSNFTVPGCGESRALKLVVDPANQFAEATESDNTLTRTVERPCPDLAIKSISKVYEGELGATYRVRVTVVNLGNARAPSNQVWATSLPGDPWPVNGWPSLTPTETIPALDPGETTSFYVGGSILASNRTAVRIMLDRNSEIAESNESNNSKDDRV